MEIIENFNKNIFGGKFTILPLGLQTLLQCTINFLVKIPERGIT